MNKDKVKIKVTVMVDSKETIFIWAGNVINQVDRATPMRCINRSQPPIMASANDPRWFIYYGLFTRDEWMRLFIDGMVMCVEKEFRPRDVDLLGKLLHRKLTADAALLIEESERRQDARREAHAFRKRKASPYRRAA